MDDFTVIHIEEVAFMQQHLGFARIHIADPLGRIL